MDEHYELIENYLAGELDGAAKVEFEKRLQQDSSLAKRLKMIQSIDFALGDTEALQLQEATEIISGKYFSSIKNETTKLVFFRKPLAIAASILFLATASFLIWQQQATPSADAVFAQYFNTYNLNEMVRGENVQNNYNRALKHYQNGDYEAAAQSFEKLTTQNQQDIPAIFGLAQSNLNQQPPQFETAVQQLQLVVQHEDNIYVQDAHWYLALILIKQGKTKEAKESLHQVITFGGQLGKKASELLKSL